MSLSVATWNINSIRLRLPLVLKFLEMAQPDVLCLQEIKCPDDLFPSDALIAAGYPHIAIHGQKGYHGVATISRIPFGERMERRDYCAVGDSRHLCVDFQAGARTIRLHNFYVPAGGDEPDRTINPKFGHKLDFVEEMKLLTATPNDGASSILVGDLNIAPLEDDVWSHKQLLKIVSHTPIETEGLTEVIRRGGWVDVMRQHVPPPEKLYTWWSYRSADWAAADKGRRLDHVWTSPDLATSLERVDILREARGWERPSDHVPVTARFSL